MPLPLHRPARNQLVWLTDRAWAALTARGVDVPRADARHALLAHWHARHLPLVVCRQPAELPAGRLAVGLPAPQRFGRQRVALDVALDDVLMAGAFPTLLQATRRYRWPAAAAALDRALRQHGIVAHVYGSHGWQMLSGERYVHGDSDIDLSLAVAGFDSACLAARALGDADWGRRLDGELVFADGSAVAWREFARAIDGRTAQLLVKRLDGPQLVPVEGLRERLDAGDSGGFFNRDADAPIAMPTWQRDPTPQALAARPRDRREAKA